MKEKRNILIYLLLGIIIGWALGFLRIPFMENNFSFWLGFITCFAVASFIVLLLFVWNKNSWLTTLIGKKPVSTDVEAIRKTYSSISTVLTLFLILALLIGSILIYRQNNRLNTQAGYLKEQIQNQAITIKKMNNNNLLLLMDVFLEKIEKELNNNAQDSLSNATISKIAGLSQTYQPYKNVGADTLSKNKISFERGQLLLGLLNLKMDTTSFNKIKRHVTFANAGLRNADLSDANLNHINLKDANLLGAKLHRTSLNKAKLNGADLSWADLTEADLKRANLNGVNLSNAILIKAQLNHATFQYSDLSSALLNEANFANSDLLGAILMKANFKNTNLNEVNLLHANVAEGWLSQLNPSKIINAEKIQANYKMVANAKRLSKLTPFRLAKKEK